jgi:integrase/recombinase XerD
LSIIEKYKNDPRVQASNKLLPTYSNQKLNSYLSEIADLCGIKKHLTSHIARHTFATTVTLCNGVPMETVSKLLGHTSIKNNSDLCKGYRAKSQ